jgi:hypothetical protein
MLAKRHKMMYRRSVFTLSIFGKDG